MHYLLDTNICVFYLRGKLNFNQFISESWRKSCCISEITVLELRYGAENSNNSQKHHQAIDLFLQGLTVVPIINVVDTYAKEKVRLRRKGMLLHDEFDLIIGSSAIANDLVLVTDNVKHFVNFENIKTENWIRN